MLKATLLDRNLLRSILQAMHCHLVDANFNFSADGMSVYEPDSSGGSVYVRLLSESFNSYRCDRNFAVKMNIWNILRIFLLGRENDILTLIGDESPGLFTFMSHDDDLEKTRSVEYDMKVSNVEFSPVSGPYINYDAVVKIRCLDLADICYSLSQFSDTVEISVWKKDCVRFFSSDDVDFAGVERYHITEAQLPATEIQLTRPIRLTVNAKILEAYPWGFNCSNQVLIGMAAGLHLVLEHEVEFGLLRFYVPTREMEAQVNI